MVYGPSEADEVQSWLDSAVDAEYITQQEFHELDGLYGHIGAQLSNMIDRPSEWCTSQAKRTQTRKTKL